MRTAISCILIGLTIGGAGTMRADPLEEITRSVDGKARRASSGLYDPESNADAYHVGAGETLTLKVIVLAAQPPREAALYWREMGQGEYRRVKLSHVARGVYRVGLPPGGATSDVEYYLEAAAGDQQVRFPATAPVLSQTLVLLPAGD